MSQPIAENRDSMTFATLLAWASSETPPVHKHRANLLIHLFAVPPFVLGHVAMLGSLVFGWRYLAIGLLSSIVAFALQGYGHSLEQRSPPPFTGPRDFIRRLYAEQFCNFWRFLFSGRWYATVRGHPNVDMADLS